MDSQRVLPGPVRQIGNVVNHLDSALADWVTLGVGPWFVKRGSAQRVTCRDEPREVTLSVALANSGELQIELIQRIDATPSIFGRFSDQGLAVIKSSTGQMISKRP